MSCENRNCIKISLVLAILSIIIFIIGIAKDVVDSIKEDRIISQLESRYEGVELLPLSKPTCGETFPEFVTRVHSAEESNRVIELPNVSKLELKIENK